MSFICSKALCLKKFKSQSTALAHHLSSRLGCQQSDIEAIEDYVKKLAPCSMDVPAPSRTKKKSKHQSPTPSASVTPPPQIDHLPPDFIPAGLTNPTEDNTLGPSTPIPESNTDIPLQNSNGYIQTGASKKGFTFTHPTAGRIYGHAPNKWETLHEDMKQLYPGNLYAMWNGQKEWQIADWMATRKVSQNDVDDLLKTELFDDESAIPFRTAKKLCDKINTELKCFGGPKWHYTDVQIGDAMSDTHLMVHRDVKEAGDYLMGLPEFSGKLAYAPVQQTTEDGVTDVYGEPCSGKMWDEWQNKSSIPQGTTIGGVVFASDKTSLSTHGGDVAAHALYMTLANLDHETRMKESRTAWILIAIIPVSKWSGTMAENPQLSKSAKSELAGVLNRHLFHRCMSVITRSLCRDKPHRVVDPDGCVRLVLYILWAYIADLEEQLVIAGLGSRCCPHCITQGTDLGDTSCQHERTSETILADIRKVNQTMTTIHGGADLETAVEFLNESKKYGLCGVKSPFWAAIPHVDISKVLSLDLLHGFYKCFYDHIVKWNLTGLTAPELDARIRSQIQLSGDRAFTKGASHLSQVTGKEHRDLLQTHVATVVDGPNGGNVKVTTATRALVDCIYLARYDSLSTKQLDDYAKSYAEFHKNKSAWIDNGTRVGKNGVIEHFNIPKLHNARHVPEQVMLKGAITNYSTETMERLHIDFIKDGYRASNRREWLQQLIRWVEKHERVRNFRVWLKWRLQRGKREGSAWFSTPADGEVLGGPNVAATTKEGGELPDQQCPRCGYALKDERKDVVSSKKRKQEDDDDEHKDGRATRVKLASNNNGTSSLQIVSVDPTLTRRTLTEASEMLGDSSLISMIQSAPELAALPGDSINEDTLIDIWDNIRIQVSNNSTDSLHRVRAHPKLDKAEAEHPDPIFYMQQDVNDPTSTRLHGILPSRLTWPALPTPTFKIPAGPRAINGVYIHLHRHTA
ncbi:hypothetical protein FRC08_017932 [Ceratobasidium sp. 394]|nr:hypothetical protein FRC08_017932 [Ceratobasidium sp. 394]